ncbi:ParB N-terminal domain-containing protein [Paraburkholderia sp. NMBU_R16]|uniref:ParB/RepB/Spo0J family partition protein n=1 Tax=Paraburkholderia sp. NMBU_R16 TaxID=2698676 RepID=UPI0015668EDD|nr:ParB/RepB/Spo0J family partition protein [Paraburkholderia sp. NMBU_R16]NRO99191.1 ParB N-terminal domain-containing protein [Paraburkholderia sp. NMBU_R16]
MGISKKLAERTSNIQATPTMDRTTAKADTRLTTPGRLLDAQLHIKEAEDRADAAVAEAATVKQQLDEARALIEELQKSGQTGGAAEVDIATLIEKPGRRRVLSPTEYEELKANLAANDLIYPVVYRPLGNGKNEIVAGHNRVAIYRDELNRTKILGIRFVGDERQAELGATFSNLLAPSLPDFEKYRQFVRLQAESGFTRSDVIKASGLSSSHVSRILAFDSLPPEALEAIAKRPDRVGGNAAEEFAALANNGNAQAVVNAIKKLIEDESLTQKRALEMARPKAPRVPLAIARPINIGKKKLCEVSVRSGVIGVRFAGKDGDAAATKWVDKIEQFIRDEIARESLGGE